MKKYRLNQIRTDIDFPEEKLPVKVAKLTGIRPEDIASWEIRRKSVDSRKKPYIQFVYTVDFLCGKKIKTAGNKNLLSAEELGDEPVPPAGAPPDVCLRPVVVGMGPCGLFAGLELAKLGYRPLIIERGPAMEERISSVEAFRREGILDPEANMLFGEGGAGTFSDGKIGTGIKDGLIRTVLREFRDAGAGEDIMYLAKPHIGTDVLRSVIVNIRRKIEALGGEILFNTKLESFIIENGEIKGIYVKKTLHDAPDAQKELKLIPAEALILAVGHSARDTFEVLRDSGFRMEPKPFSIGVRMEHPQRMIDAAQYGEENAGKLPPADYRLSCKASNGRGVYSFCMCPGGEVVVCSTREGELCVNGMSNRRRDSGTANSGILCDVRTEDFENDDVLAGVRFQEKYERLAFINGGGGFRAPSCSMREFLDGDSEAAGRVIASLPGFASEAIREAVPEFGRRIKGFDSDDAVVTAVETRSSSPVRILRNEKGAGSIRGVYPAGEGAGYAGGITSAACDGIRAAWHLSEQLNRAYSPIDSRIP